MCDEVHLMYVPGHKDIAGIELADKYAKTAATLPGPPDTTVPLRAALSAIKAEIKDPPIQHHLGGKFYNQIDQERDHEEIKTRRHATILAQIRSGHYIGLAYYDAMVDKTGQTEPTCRRCNSGKTDNTEHWLTECAATLAARQLVFGRTNIDMVELILNPLKIIRLVEKTLEPAT